MWVVWREDEACAKVSAYNRNNKKSQYVWGVSVDEPSKGGKEEKESRVMDSIDRVSKRHGRGISDVPP